MYRCKDKGRAKGVRRVKLWTILMLVCIALGGCQVSGELENQAYVLVLGIDRTEGGGLELTARVPKIGKSQEPQGGEAQGDDPYLTFTVAADGWPRALEALQRATPRRMNLSHIELLVVSEALAGEAGFPTLARQVARTPHLYTTASLVVCRGQARDFVEAGETVIGTRMSAEIRAMLKHYADQGYIPEACFADADFAANSIYSDPLAIWGYAETDAGDAWVIDSPMKQRFASAALMRNGVFIRALSVEETRLLNLIRGRTKSFQLDWTGVSIELTPAAAACKNVIWNGEQPTLYLHVRLICEEALPQVMLDRAADELRRKLEVLIQGCQRERCDPFGFAEIAAGHFPTVPQWLACDWRSLYAAAPVVIDAEITAE